MKTHFHSGGEVTKLSDDGGSGSDHAIIGRATATAVKHKRRREETSERSETLRSSSRCINVSRRIRTWQ